MKHCENEDCKIVSRTDVVKASISCPAPEQPHEGGEKHKEGCEITRFGEGVCACNTIFAPPKASSLETLTAEMLKKHLLANFCDGDSWMDARADTFTHEGALDIAEYFHTLGKKAGREEMVETVVCAAVMASDGSIYRGHRHGHAMRAVRDEGKELMNDRRQQGFITTRNRYVSREEARLLQDAAGIPSADKDGYRANTLFSEDLYQSHKDVVLALLPAKEVEPLADEQKEV